MIRTRIFLIKRKKHDISIVLKTNFIMPGILNLFINRSKIPEQTDPITTNMTYLYNGCYILKRLKVNQYIRA